MLLMFFSIGAKVEGLWYGTSGPTKKCPSTFTLNGRLMYINLRNA